MSKRSSIFEKISFFLKYVIHVLSVNTLPCSAKMIIVWSILFNTLYVGYAITYINVNDSESIVERYHIDDYFPAFSVAVTGSRPALRAFDKKYWKLLRSTIARGPERYGPTRGVTPYNWAKLVAHDGSLYGLFSYKTINSCNEIVSDTKLHDFIDIVALRTRFNDNPEFFMTRTMLGRSISIHTVTTPATEIYFVYKSFSNITSLLGAHSDVRIIPFSQNCRYFEMHRTLKSARYVLTGAVHIHDWHENQFLAVADENFDIIYSSILFDPEEPERTQKNWMPFWDGCKLMFTKRFGPEHVVSEFTGWKTLNGRFPMKDLIRTPSPAFVPSEYMIRGSAPVISHPLLDRQFLLGCVHLHGKTKVYRHALYVMSSSYPYEILSFSPLFAFKPYRPIEFVMSLFVSKNGDLELSHGSMDCEPKLAIIPVEKVRVYFREYLKIE